MAASGDIALVEFPYSNLSKGKKRPVLVLGKCPGRFDDLLICPISSKQHQATPGFDDLINPSDTDFASSGLISPSVIRVCRLAVVESSLLMGTIGSVDPVRLKRVKDSLKIWINNL